MSERNHSRSPQTPQDGSAVGSAPGEGGGAGESGVRIVLVTRAGCHLCDDARVVIAKVSAELGVGWREMDADADPETADAYGDRLPVILVDGREHGYWRVEEERLRRALAGDRWSWRTGRAGRSDGSRQRGGSDRDGGPKAPRTS
ncbi:glutaredoxin family protein [Frankia sp. CH37]|nr:glutaredoxin family protein [Parafrankia sp. CH37]